MSDVDYAARVRRGAEFLDDLRPGWEREINIDHLVLENSCRCVLGQLYGHYLTGLEVLMKAGIPKALIPAGTVEIHAHELGFNIPASEMGDRRGPSPYRQLDELWIAEIRTRLRPAAATGPPVPVVATALELQPA